ncbi:MAG: polyphosphate kinase 2, partial [Novosphingobium sp.]|nr:polyphosphate kinase 2 [Novosphingobium sp.]
MGKLKRKEYHELLEPLEIELVGMARWAKTTGARILVIFEGRDT